MVEARRVIARYLARRGWSSVMIGRYLERDHTTVLHHLKRRSGGLAP
jgi:chromosomal replication initiation ATPase DnaA